MLSDTLNFEPLNDFCSDFELHKKSLDLYLHCWLPGKVNVFDSMCTSDIPLH